MLKRFSTLILVATAAVSGCTSMQEVSEAKGNGVKRSYHQPYDVVWDSAVSAVASTELDVVEQEKQQGRILAKNGMTLDSYGENVAVFVERESDTKTNVEVVSRSVVKSNITATDWTDYILDSMQKELK